jgi:hypothetical protein
MPWRQVEVMKDSPRRERNSLTRREGAGNPKEFISLFLPVVSIRVKLLVVAVSSPYFRGPA